MKIYPKLAWNGIRSNRKFYLPYILTGIGLVMVFYIISFLQMSPLLDKITGGETTRAVLALGKGVIGIFAVILMFYTNSFLIRRRKKEFGLYNILGMGKKNIGYILLAETIIIAFIILTVGLSAGLAFSKLAELGLLNVIRGEITYDLSFSISTINQTIILFCGIFAMIFVNTLRQIHTADPVTLLRSENSGEKPPKGNWLFGLLGIILLAGAYYIAVSIQNPLAALVWFFIAVVAVILATYLIFIAGSVLMCRILQKNKRYYYKKAHFVSVSSMAYRMKRNGAGLASICILATMVLVMLVGASCLYFGAEGSLHNRFPRDITSTIGFYSVTDTDDDNINELRSKIDAILDENQVEANNVFDYIYAVVTGVLTDSNLTIDASTYYNSMDLSVYNTLRQMYFIPIDDYNRISGTNEQLGENEIMIYCVRCSYPYETLTIADGTTYTVKKTLDSFVASGFATVNITPSMFVVIPKIQENLSPLLSLCDIKGYSMISPYWYYGFDTNASESIQHEVTQQILDMFRETASNETNGVCSLSCENLTENREDFYNTFGGIFFLGIILSIVFLCATVLIIYYKQVTEGFEDQARFEIMQKVGMSKRDIRKSINSQMLTVFFLPLITAILHLTFAFPMIQKLLLLFNLNDFHLLLIVTGITTLVFALFYTLVYRVTSNAYFSIVSGAKDK